MKPTRHIVKPMKGLWTPKRSPWFRKNDDNIIPDCPDCGSKMERSSKGWNFPETQAHVKDKTFTCHECRMPHSSPRRVIVKG